MYLGICSFTNEFSSPIVSEFFTYNVMKLSLKSLLNTANLNEICIFNYYSVTVEVNRCHNNLYFYVILPIDKRHTVK